MLCNNYIKQQNIPFSLLFQLYFILYFTINFVKAEQKIVEEPEDTVARIGETILLKCRVQNQVRILR